MVARTSDGQVVFSLADADLAIPDGQLLARFGSEGYEPGQLCSPETIAVDGQGRIYVSDFKGIQVFATDGRYQGKFNVQGFARGLDFTDQSELWVVTNKPQATGYKIVK